MISVQESIIGYDDRVDRRSTTLHIVAHAYDSRGSKAFSGVCSSVNILYVCLCVFVRTIKPKRAETKIIKLDRGISPSRVLDHQLIINQKVTCQGHRVAECKKAIEWPA